MINLSHYGVPTIDRLWKQIAYIEACQVAYETYALRHACIRLKPEFSLKRNNFLRSEKLKASQW